MAETFGFDGNSVDRIREVVRKVEGCPDDELASFRKQKGVVGEQNLLQWVRCLTGGDSQGRRRAVWCSYDEATNVYTNVAGGDCYLRPGPNGEPLVTGRRYLARRQGSHPTDGLPVYVPVGHTPSRCHLHNGGGGFMWPEQANDNPKLVPYVVRRTNDTAIFPLLATHNTLILRRPGLYHLEASVSFRYVGEFTPPYHDPATAGWRHLGSGVQLVAEASLSDQSSQGHMVATLPFHVGDPLSRWPGKTVSVSYTIGITPYDGLNQPVRPRLFFSFFNVFLPWRMFAYLEHGSITRIGDYKET